MRYYKIMLDEKIVTLETLDRDDKTKGNLTKKEYDSIMSVIKKCPDDKIVVEKDGEYTYDDIPKEGEKE